MRSESDIQAEVRRLWAAVFDEPAAEDADAGALLDRLVQSLPTPGYDTMRRYGVVSPFDRVSRG